MVYRTAALARLGLRLLWGAALAGALPAHAQTPAPAPAPQASPPGKPAPPPPSEDLHWSALGASAQCRDGSYFHGEFDRHACADHGGVRRVLPGPGQDLLR